MASDRDNDQAAELNEPTFAYLRRGPKMARSVEEILGLPNGRWTDCRVEFGVGNIAKATLTLTLTPTQLQRLSEVAAHPYDPAPDSSVVPDGQ